MKTYQVEQKQNAAQKLTAACVARCQKLIAQVAQAKSNVLAEFRGTFGAQQKLLRIALNEAEALAWQTDYPHLLFPSLALEKVKAAANWQQRQQLIRRPQFVYALAA